jgi:two-component system chemotaxis response regulator CheY
MGTREGMGRVARILVVDDAAFARVRTSRTLIGAGHEVLEADNGRRAIEMYQEHRPDLVLLDITMPEMDGIETLSELRRLDPGAQVAMLTAVGHQSVVVDAIKRGARDFLVKPIEPERLLAVVGRLVAS